MKKTVLVTAFIVVITSVALILFVKLTSRQGNEVMNFT